MRNSVELWERVVSLGKPLRNPWACFIVAFK